MTLADLSTGDSCVVLNIKHGTNLRKRLIDLGFIPGTIVGVKKIAPLGDPIEVTIRSYELTLRRTEAEMIQIKKKLKAR